MRYLIAAATSSLIVSIATAPYIVYHFNYFSIIGVVANIIAVPVTAFAVIPLGLVYLVMDCISSSVLVSRALEASVAVILHTAHYAANIEWLIPTLRSIPASAVSATTLGLLVFSWWRGSFKIALGLFFTLLGLLLAITYRTPDIFFSVDGVAVKEGDGKLYFAARAGSRRGFAYSVWARENGQARIADGSLFGGKKKRLVCTERGCIYDGRVLISCDVEFISQHCSEVDLVLNIGGSRNQASCDHVPSIGYNDIKNRGVHYVSLNESFVKVESARTERSWHLNAASFVRRKKYMTKTSGGRAEQCLPIVA